MSENKEYLGNEEAFKASYRKAVAFYFERNVGFIKSTASKATTVALASGKEIAEKQLYTLVNKGLDSTALSQWVVLAIIQANVLTASP